MCPSNNTAAGRSSSARRQTITGSERRAMFVVCWLAVIGSVSAAVDWGYDNSHGNGPAQWSASYPTCGRSSQSPIDIESSKTTMRASQVTLTRYDASTGYTFSMNNNGHSVTVAVSGSQPITLGLSEVTDNYNLAQFHFHWGDHDTAGSEHTVDGKAYPLEIHFVHYRSSYGNISEAIKHEDGLAVLGIFAQVGDHVNDALNKVVSKFDSVTYKGQETSVETFALRGLMPANIDDFARYSGSLTTPGCNEVVTWTVFRDPITISSAQMQKFRGLKEGVSGSTVALVNNYRPVQPLNGRNVYVTYTVTAGNTNSGPSGPATPLATAVFAALFSASFAAIARP